MLISRSDCLVMVIDVQERLARAVENNEEIISRIKILCCAADELEVPVLVTEQYPKGLGPTLEAIRVSSPLAPTIEKTEFCSARSASIADTVAAKGKQQLLLVGMETHICVLQSALGFRGLGYDVFVAADGTGSRTGQSKARGLDRMRQSSIGIVDTEMVVFEWLERAGTEAFKRVQNLVK